MQINYLSPEKVENFYKIFTHVLKTEFPGYDPKVSQYLLDKIYNVPTFKYWTTNKEKVVLTGEFEGKIVGFALIDSVYGGVSFCRWLGVMKDHQHQGIGTALVYAWEKLAKDSGAHKMEVAGQPEATEFYKKVGLTLEGKRLKSYFGIDQYLFGKVLSEPDAEKMVK